MLQITKLTLNNFMIHSNLELEFTSGINAISGMNGVGKSSIITAIGFALFNINTKQNQGQLISKDKGTAKITVEFLFNNKKYILERSLGVSTWVSLEIPDGERSKKVYSSKAVYETLSELLEINSLGKIFENILSIRSPEIVSPFSSDLQRRRDFFIGSLGLEKYELVWSKLRPVVSNLEGRIQSTNENKSQGIELRRKITSLRSDNKDLEDQIELNKKCLQDLSEKGEVLRIYRDEYRTEIEEKYRIEAELRASESKRKSLQGRINSQLKKLNEPLENCPYCGKPMDDAGKLAFNQKKSSELNKSLAFLKSELKDVEETITSLELKLSQFREMDYDNLVQKADNEILTLQKDIEVAEHKIKINDESIEAYLSTIKDHLSAFRKHNNSVKSIAIVNSIRDGMRTLSSTVNSAMVQDISEIGSHFLTEILGKYCRIHIKNNYNIDVIIEGDTFEFNQLSDGIQIMVGLAIRLSMTRFCSDLGIVFLDEPTINLHNNVKASLLEAIKNLGFNQIFVISHDDTFVASTDNLIRLGIENEI